MNREAIDRLLANPKVLQNGTSESRPVKDPEVATDLKEVSESHLKNQKVQRPVGPDVFLIEINRGVGSGKISAIPASHPLEESRPVKDPEVATDLKEISESHWKDDQLGKIPEVRKKVISKAEIPEQMKVTVNERILDHLTAVRIQSLLQIIQNQER
ncbi:MAG: hypothetical protein K8R21_07000 [Leptospira sp.]|nr:hypothetical protein [Leptospira sp.]